MSKVVKNVLEVLGTDLLVYLEEKERQVLRLANRCMNNAYVVVNMWDLMRMAMPGGPDR